MVYLPTFVGKHTGPMDPMGIVYPGICRKQHSLAPQADKNHARNRTTEMAPHFSTTLLLGGSSQLVSPLSRVVPLTNGRFMAYKWVVTNHLQVLG